MLLLSLLLLTAVLQSCCCQASGQRYAERNVLPEPSYPYHTSPSLPDDTDYYGEDEDDYYGTFGEDEDQRDIYKWTVDQYPHPVSTPRFCNRMRPSHVCDPDMVLSREQADLLDESINQLYRETPCICDACDAEGGIVVGIALLKHLYHPYHMHHAKVIRSFAEALRVRWKLGSCDNDILIVVATTDRLSYTDVGRATSDYLSVHEAHRIFLENKAQFSAANFSQGLHDILAGYRRATSGMEASMRRRAQGSGPDMALLTGSVVGSVLILGILLFIGVLVYRRCKGRRTKDAPDDDVEPGKRRVAGETVSKSWSKKDIKILFGPQSSQKRSAAAYQKCGTTDEPDDTATPRVEGEDNDDDDAREETMDLTLATPDDTSFERSQQRSTESQSLETELDTATAGLVRTFRSHSRSDVLVTDM